MEGIKYGKLTLTPIQSGEAYSVTECERDALDAVIPAQIDGIPVTEIGEYAFDGCASLRSVSFPEGEAAALEEIGEYAFNGCVSLDSVRLPECLYTIGRGAFYGCKSLKRAEFSESAYVAAYAFSHCESLTSVTKTKYASEGAFSFCSALDSLPLSEGAKMIDEDAFEHCVSLKDAVIPASTVRIEALAFRSCTALRSVVFEETDGWFATNCYREGETALDLSDPKRNAELLSRMDFDDGWLAWERK